MKIYAIGDIHGCLDELKELFVSIDYLIGNDDEVVFLGDYIDRGPDSKGVIDFVIDRLSDKEKYPHKYTALTGNHEVMMLEKEYYWPMNGGIETLKSYGNDIENVPAAHWTFLQNLNINYKVGRTVFVHAGLDPYYGLEEQISEQMLWDRNWVGYDGTYKGDYMVVFGHTPKDKVIEKKNQVNIDTGCVFGNKLTCAILEPENGIIQGILSVKSSYDWRNRFDT